MPWFSLMHVICNNLGRRQEAEDLIENELKRARPARWFAELLQLPWELVFTTNYDSLPDIAQALGVPLTRRTETYKGGRYPEGTTLSELPIVKIMGDAADRYPAKSAMILAESDRSLNLQGASYRFAVAKLREAIDDGVNIVVLGQSLADGILMHVLMDIVNTKGAKPAGRVYLVGTSPPAWDIELGLAKLNSHQVEATAEQLAAGLRGAEGPLPIERTRRIRLQGRTVNIGAPVLRLLDGTTELIDELHPGTAFSEPAAFLARSSYGKAAFDSHWDFLRDLVRVSQDGRVIVRKANAPDIVTDIRSFALRDPKHILLGPPGSAKTMTCLRVAHDWALAGGIVLFLNARRHAPGGAAVAECIRALQTEIAVQAQLQPSALSPGILVIIDNVAQDTRVLDSLQHACRTRDIKDFALLVTGRPPELESVRARFDVGWELHGQIDDTEAHRLAEYARGMPNPPSDGEVALVLGTSHHLGFWGCLYQLVAPTRKPLEEAVVDYARGLSGWERDVVAFAAYCEALDLPLPIKVLSRIIQDRDRVQLTAACNGGMLSQLVYLESREGVEVLHFINRPAAEAILRAWKDDRPAFQLLISYIQNLSGYPGEERQVAPGFINAIARRRYLPGSLAEEVLPMPDREVLMGIFADSYPSATSLHHHGRLQRRRKMFRQAIHTLEAALLQPDAEPERERINQSIAFTCVRWARFLIERRETAADVQTLLDRAQASMSRLTGSPTYYYTLKAEWLRATAMSTPDDRTAQGLLEDAFLQAKHARLFARDHEARSAADMLIQDLAQARGQRVVTLADARAMARDHHVSAGFHALLERKVGSRTWATIPLTDVEEALQLMDEALSANPGDAVALQAFVRLRILQDPTAGIESQLMQMERLQMSDEALLVRAYQAASANRQSAMRAALAELQARFPTFTVPAERRAEFILQNNAGPVRFKVQGGRPNWIQVAGARQDAHDWEPGNEVLVEVTPNGLLLRSAA